MGVVSVAPGHGLFPIEEHEQKSSGRVEEHHHHKHRQLFCLIARYVDRRQQCNHDYLMVLIFDILQGGRFASHIDWQENQAIEECHKEEEYRCIPVEDDV